MTGLTPKRRKFAAEYVRNGFNGVQAIYAAGYKMGYNSARTEAWRLLTKPDVQKAVKENIKSSKMSAAEVLERLTTIARTEADFKGSDVVKANELLGKGHKLFIERVETTDKTESSNLFERTILKHARKKHLDPNEVAVEFIDLYSDESDEDYDAELLKPEHWGQFAHLLSKPGEVEGVQ